MRCCVLVRRATVRLRDAHTHLQGLLFLCRRADMQQSDSRIPFASSLNTRWYERIRPPPRTVASVRRRPATGHGLGRSPHMIHHPSSNIDSRTEFRDRHVPLPTAPMCPKRGQHASRGAARDRTVCEHRAQQTRPGRRCRRETETWRPTLRPNSDHTVVHIAPSPERHLDEFSSARSAHRSTRAYDLMSR